MLKHIGKLNKNRKGDRYMKEVLDVLRQLESESSRTRKEKILKDNQSNELLKKTLLYALDPYKIYGIGTKSIDLNFKTPVGVDSYYNFFDLLDWLSVNNGGSDVAKLEVNKFISRVDEEDKEWYKRIILKDLRCGISETTVNKIFDAWIPTFDVMLAKKFEDHQHKIKGDFAVTLKIDGVRCAILKENGSIKMMSRQGQLFEDFDELLEEIKLLPDNMVYCF
jgi:DNA ligase-1